MDPTIGDVSYSVSLALASRSFLYRPTCYRVLVSRFLVCYRMFARLFHHFCESEQTIKSLDLKLLLVIWLCIQPYFSSSLEFRRKHTESARRAGQHFNHKSAEETVS